MDLSELDIANLATRLSDNPQSPLFARLADLYLSRERIDEAVALCEQGIGLYPSYAGGHIVLGKCYRQRGEIGKAREAFRQALVLSPYNTVVHRLLVTLPESVDEGAVPFSHGVAAEGPNADTVVRSGEHAALPESARDMSDGQVQTDAVPGAGLPSPGTSDTPGEETTAPASRTDAAQTSSGVTIEPADEIVEMPEMSPAEPAWMPVYEPMPADAATAVSDTLQTERPADAAGSGMQETQTEAQPEAEPHVETEADTEAETEEAAAPSFDPFPTFEQYIDLHPTMEPTMTLEEYLKGRDSSPMSEPSTDFESLAKKLQSAKRIVPTDGPDAAAAVPPAAEDSSLMVQAIVSPTMAEIYASQREFAAAIAAYEMLIVSQPAQAALFTRRIEELQALQKNKPA